MCDSSKDNSKHNVAPEVSPSQEIQKILESLHCRSAPIDNFPATPADQTLDLLRDRAVLLEAQETLSQTSQDKLLEIVLWGQISAMLGVINLFLDTDLLYTWRKASMIIVKA